MWMKGSAVSVIERYSRKLLSAMKNMDITWKKYAYYTVCNKNYRVKNIRRKCFVFKILFSAQRLKNSNQNFNSQYWPLHSGIRSDFFLLIYPCFLNILENIDTFEIKLCETFCVIVFFYRHLNKTHLGPILIFSFELFHYVEGKSWEFISGSLGIFSIICCSFGWVSNINFVPLPSFLPVLVPM